MCLVGAFYLVDCLIGIIRAPAGTPFFERGVYAGGPAGFWVTVVVFLVGIWHLIFWKNDEKK
jgi:hypothetical protein